MEGLAHPSKFRLSPGLQHPNGVLLPLDAVLQGLNGLRAQAGL